MKSFVSGLICLAFILGYFWDSKHLPNAYHYDSLSNLLDAFCLTQTGADQWGRPWPWNFRAFNDFRPPIVNYIIAAVGVVFPLNLYVGRLVCMVLGLLGVSLLFVYFRKELGTPRLRWSAPLLFGLVLLSPWVLVQQRIIIEPAGVIFFVGLLMISTWELVKKPSSKSLGILNGVAWASMLYLYYGNKPLFFTQFLIFYLGLSLTYSKLKQHFEFRGVYFSILIHMIVVLGKETVFSGWTDSRIVMTPLMNLLAWIFMITTSRVLIRNGSSILWGLVNGGGMALVALFFEKGLVLHVSHIVFIFILCVWKLGGVKFSRKYQGALLAPIIAILLSIPTLMDFMGPKRTLSRATAVTHFSFESIVSTYAQHISPKFLFFEGDKNRRHHHGYGGELNVALFPFFLMGLGSALLLIFRKRSWFWLYVIGFMLIGFIPVSVTNEGLPHSLRTLHTLPPILFIIYLGYLSVETRIHSKWSKVAMYLYLGLGSVEAYRGLIFWEKDTPIQESLIWNYYPDTYKLPDSVLDMDSRYPETILERYHRTFVTKEKVYCESLEKGYRLSDD